MTYRVIDRGVIEHRDLNALAVLAPSPAELTRRWGLTFDSVTDDLDTVSVLAVQVGDTYFLLMRGDHEPGKGTNLLTPDSGDPVALTQQFLAAMSLTPDEVLTRWTGVHWLTPSNSAT